MSNFNKVSNQFTNSLINETSPYLLQHAHNPVNWFAWGEVALKKARDENKIILVSIGYSACHWCHVMEKESFESEETAAIMNEHFVNIKIDREERPDLDHLYMDAVQAMTGSGGWPLNVFLTPGKKPFFGGTYYPPVKAFNRPSWPDVLYGVSSAWRERQNEIEAQSENLTAHLEQANDIVTNLPGNTDNSVSALQQCEEMFANSMKNADKVWGGFGNAPKFPQTFTIQFLLQYYYYTENKEALTHAMLSIDKMLQGGIYDHISGGLARYSTDREWLAPHFEKMLYDNALLINILCDAYQLTLKDSYANAIRKTIGFVLNELADKDGTFFSALDADSEGEEGKYYIWHKKEIDEILGEDASLFCSFFNVTENGNWEGKNILRVLLPSNDFVQERGIDKAVFEEVINACLQKLSAKRNQRIRPGLDDKIILSWNALMIKAMARAAVVLQDTSYYKMAEESFTVIEKHFCNTEHAGLFHTYKNGIAKYPGFLDDYAFMINACIQMYHTTYKTVYLNRAKDYCHYVIENFSDDEEVFFYFTHKKQSDIVVRKKEIYDGATPSGNSIMAENLSVLSVIFDEKAWAQRSAKMLTSLTSTVVKYPGSFGIWACQILPKPAGLNEIAVVGKNALSVANEISLNFLPHSIIMASLTENCEFPMLTNKPAGSTLIYLCKNYSCSLPHLTVNSLLKEIIKSTKIRI